MPRKIEISHKTIIFAVLFLISLGFLYFIRDIILELFVALLLMTILEPLVSKLTKIRIPRAFSVLLSYLVFLGIFGGAISLIIPPLVEQTTSFANFVPSYISNMGINPAISDQVIKEVLTAVGSIPSQVIKFSVSLFSNILAVFTVLAFAFYLLMFRGRLDEQLSSFFGAEQKEKITRTLSTLETRLGGWARGELILMLLVGVLNFIALSLLKVPFALPLAILSGILEIVPYLGPILGAIPGILIGFGISPLTGLGFAASAFLIQQLENYVFVPKIMEKSVGVSPIITILALSIGGRIAGIVGIIISVPVVITLSVLLKEYFTKE
jgi:predicted PurR-regulated permease PerM